MNQTQTETNLKLARDIAEIRLANMSRQTASTASVANELVAAMHDLDAGHEDALITEIKETVSKDASRAEPRVVNTYDKYYTNMIIRKLQVRIKQKVAAKQSEHFAPSDYDAAQNSDQTLMENVTNILIKKIGIDSAAGATAATPATGTTPREEFLEVLPYQLFEVYGRDTKKLMTALNNRLGIAGAAQRITKITVSYPAERIVNIVGINYYGSWIYDRSILRGVLVATIA